MMPHPSAGLAVLVAALSVAVASAALAVAAGSGGSSTVAVPEPVSDDGPARSSEPRGPAMTVNQIYRRDAAGVVNIKVSTTAHGPLGFSAQEQAEEARSPDNG